MIETSAKSCAKPMSELRNTSTVFARIKAQRKAAPPPAGVIVKYQVSERAQVPQRGLRALIFGPLLRRCHLACRNPRRMTGPWRHSKFSSLRRAPVHCVSRCRLCSRFPDHRSGPLAGLKHHAIGTTKLQHSKISSSTIECRHDLHAAGVSWVIYRIRQGYGGQAHHSGGPDDNSD